MDLEYVRSNLDTVLTKYTVDLVPKVIEFLLIVIVGYFVVSTILRYLKAYFIRSKRLEETVERFIYTTVSTISWAFILLVALDAVEVDVTPLIAGFGVAGFAVGFALKDTLNNFVSGTMLIFYKPLKVGEDVQAAGVTGRVKEIGMSLTKIITEEDVVVYIPNSKIWGDKITNYTRRSRSKKPENL